MSKKILLILGIVIVIGVAAFFVLTERPVGEGETRVGFSIRDFLPFGRGDGTTIDLPSDNINLDDELGGDEGAVVAPNQPIPALRKVSSQPAAGAAIWNVGTTTFVRWVEKGTGNVYEASSVSVQIRRLTNTTIPQIVRAFWLPNGSGFLAQTITPETEIIETSFVALTRADPKTAENLTPYTTKISKLPTGIKELSVSPDGKKIFYYTTGSSANFYTSNPDGTGETRIMTHPLTEWLPRFWPSNSSLVLQTKEGGGVGARFYTLNLSAKTLARSTDPLADAKEVVPVLLDKCALPVEDDGFIYCASPTEGVAGVYPDDWYMGKVFTVDALRKIDTENGVYYNQVDLGSEAGENIDVVDLDASPDQSHLVFRNKLDGFLWILRLPE